MTSKTFLVALCSFAFGWIAVSALKRGGDDSKLEAELAEARAEIEELKERPAVKPKLTTLPSAIPEKVEEVVAEVEEEEGVGEEKEENPASDFAALLNSKEARSLIKRMSGGFAQRGEQWIEKGIAEYAEKLNLSDEQVAKLKERLGKNLAEQTATFTAKLDNESLSMAEIMAEQRTVMEGQEEVMAEILKDELTEEQYVEYERGQLEEKTQRVQRDADRELERLDGSLELSDTQKDQVFGILVQTNSQFDESMAIEGSDAEVTIDEGQGKEDAIRAVLDEDQGGNYDKYLEERQERRRGWGGFGGGGFGR